MKRMLLSLILCAPAFGSEDRIDLIDFRELPLMDAARVISEASGLNVVASVNAAKTPVNLYLSDVAPRDAIQALCRSHNLWFSDDEKSGIIRIHTPQEYQRDLASFQEEQTQVFDLRFPNAYDLGRTIRDLYGNRVHIALDSQEDTRATDDLQQRFERFDVVDGRSQQLGSVQGTSTTGSQSNQAYSSNSSRYNQGQTSSSGTSSASGRQTNAPIKPQRLEGLSNEEIQALQENPGEDAASQKLLSAREDIFVTVIQRLNKVIVRTSDERAMKQIRELVAKVDVPTRTVLLEVKILRVSLNKGFTSSVDYLFGDGKTQVGLGSTTDTTSNSGDLVFRYSSKNFSARLQVLEQQGQIHEVATPTLLIANNEVSRLFIGEERPLNRSFSGGTVVPGSTNTVVTSGSTDIQFRPVGTTLLITPNINADKSVMLRLVQENSNINVKGASVLVPDSNGFTTQTVDTVQSRTVSGTVVAHDQVPVVIGGLIDSTATDTRSGVPFLGRIPVFGTLFGDRDKTTTRDELVLLINPHVVDSSEGGARASQQFLSSNHVNVPREVSMQQYLDNQLAGQTTPPPASPQDSKDGSVDTPPQRKSKERKSGFSGPLKK